MISTNGSEQPIASKNILDHRSISKGMKPSRKYDHVHFPMLHVPQEHKVAELQPPTKGRDYSESHYGKRSIVKQRTAIDTCILYSQECTSKSINSEQYEYMLVRSPYYLVRAHCATLSSPLSPCRQLDMHTIGIDLSHQLHIPVHPGTVKRKRNRKQNKKTQEMLACQNRIDTCMRRDGHSHRLLNFPQTETVPSQTSKDGHTPQLKVQQTLAHSYKQIDSTTPKLKLKQIETHTQEMQYTQARSSQQQCSTHTSGASHGRVHGSAAYGASYCHAHVCMHTRAR